MSINTFDEDGNPVPQDLSIKSAAETPFAPIQQAYVRDGEEDPFQLVYTRGDYNPWGYAAIARGAGIGSTVALIWVPPRSVTNTNGDAEPNMDGFVVKRKIWELEEDPYVTVTSTLASPGKIFRGTTVDEAIGAAISGFLWTAIREELVAALNAQTGPTKTIVQYIIGYDDIVWPDGSGDPINHSAGDLYRASMDGGLTQFLDEVTSDPVSNIPEWDVINLLTTAWNPGLIDGILTWGWSYDDYPFNFSNGAATVPSRANGAVCNGLRGGQANAINFHQTAPMFTYGSGTGGFSCLRTTDRYIKGAAILLNEPSSPEDDAAFTTKWQYFDRDAVTKWMAVKAKTLKWGAAFRVANSVAVGVAESDDGTRLMFAKKKQIGLVGSVPTGTAGIGEISTTGLERPFRLILDQKGADTVTGYRLNNVQSTIATEPGGTVTSSVVSEIGWIHDTGDELDIRPMDEFNFWAIGNAGIDGDTANRLDGYMRREIPEVTIASISPNGDYIELTFNQDMTLEAGKSAIDGFYFTSTASLLTAKFASATVYTRSIRLYFPTKTTSEWVAVTVLGPRTNLVNAAGKKLASCGIQANDGLGDMTNWKPMDIPGAIDFIDFGESEFFETTGSTYSGKKKVTRVRGRGGVMCTTSTVDGTRSYTNIASFDSTQRGLWSSTSSNYNASGATYISNRILAAFPTSYSPGSGFTVAYAGSPLRDYDAKVQLMESPGVVDQYPRLSKAQGGSYMPFTQFLPDRVKIDFGVHNQIHESYLVKDEFIAIPSMVSTQLLHQRELLVQAGNTKIVTTHGGANQPLLTRTRTTSLANTNNWHDTNSYKFSYGHLNLSGNLKSAINSQEAILLAITAGEYCHTQAVFFGSGQITESNARRLLWYLENKLVFRMNVNTKCQNVVGGSFAGARRALTVATGLVSPSTHTTTPFTMTGTYSSGTTVNIPIIAMVHEFGTGNVKLYVGQNLEGFASISVSYKRYSDENGFTGALAGNYGTNRIGHFRNALGAEMHSHTINVGPVTVDYADNLTHYDVTLGSENNVNLYNKFVALYGAPSGPVEVFFTMASSAIIGSTSTSTAALLNPTNWPAGSLIKLLNNLGGTVSGKGGQGGQGAVVENGMGTPGSNGTAGGDALRVDFPLIVDNTGGTIQAGGGGGAGGGAAAASNPPQHNIGCGGAGGGGAGQEVGQGGAGRVLTTAISTTDGSDGTLTTGGAPGSTFRAGTMAAAGNGGVGGAPGQPGSPSYMPGGGPIAYTGGPAGRAVVGNANVTWVGTGTRLGAIV